MTKEVAKQWADVLKLAFAGRRFVVTTDGGHSCSPLVRYYEPGVTVAAEDRGGNWCISLVPVSDGIQTITCIGSGFVFGGDGGRFWLSARSWPEKWHHDRTRDPVFLRSLLLVLDPHRDLPAVIEAARIALAGVDEADRVGVPSAAGGGYCGSRP